MKALSIKQPWAYLVVSGAKPIENRTWRTSWRGPLLIHASKEIDQDGFDDAEDKFGAIDRRGLVLGAIIGIADLVEVIKRGQSFSWHLANPQRFKQPIACPGRLMLWTPPPAVIRATAAAASGVVRQGDDFNSAGQR